MSEIKYIEHMKRTTELDRCLLRAIEAHFDTKVNSGKLGNDLNVTTEQ